MLRRAVSSLPRLRLAATAGVAATAALLAGGGPAPRAAGLQGRINAKHTAARALRQGIAADSQRARVTGSRLSAAQRSLSAIQSELDARTAQLAQVRSALVQARTRLTELENRLQEGELALAANLRQVYEGDRPDWMTVVFEAKGFADLLERLQFLQRIRSQDVSVVRYVHVTRTEVLAQASRLGVLEVRDRRLAAVVLGRRNQVAAARTALARERLSALSRRARKAARLQKLRHQLARLEARQARVARSANGIHLATGGAVQPPAGAPVAVARVIAAGNAIAGLPYRYGGGHGSFHDQAYDCSGSVSYALAAAGLLSAPLDSTGFESWGQPGPGRWITVYANAGHAFMVVAGWRFDTSDLGSGTRWSQSQRSTGGFTARHPPGL